LDKIFGNLEEVILISGEFLTQLEYRVQVEKSSSIGTIFLALQRPFLKAYYEESCNLLRNLKITNEKFAQELEKLEKKALTSRNLALLSYLIMPIQRIPVSRLMRLLLRLS
jgi:hypothetical protein